MLLKTTTEKYIVESTFQGLTDKVMGAVLSSSEVDLKGFDLGNGFTVSQGTLKVESDTVSGAIRAVSDGYRLVIDITSATDSNEQNLSLDYVSSLTIENGTVTGIKPISTEAKLNDAVIDDIDSNTFIPVALAFYNTDLLSKLGQLMNDVLNKFGENLGITMDSMSLTVQDIKVDVDCIKSFIMPDGSGALVFRLPEVDNQWHTMSSVADKLTIDGWAEIAINTKIEQTDTPIIKDDNDRKLSDAYVAGELAPKIYGIYITSQLLPEVNFNLGKTDSFKASTPEQLTQINEIVHMFLGDGTSASSFEIKGSKNTFSQPGLLTPENPGKVNIKMNLSSTGPIEIDINIFEYSNDISDSQIVRIEIGDEDYSYLSLDVLKSMIRVFGAYVYIGGGYEAVMSDISSTIGSHHAGETITCQLTPDMTDEEGYYNQMSYSGTVTINVQEPVAYDSITETISATGTFSFAEVEAHDEIGDVTYVVSGDGSYDMPYYTIEHFTMRGVGEATQEDLLTTNTMLRYQLDNMMVI